MKQRDLNFFTSRRPNARRRSRIEANGFFGKQKTADG
jgi:hypothetical protein